jgi:hypothetical protein
MNCSASATLSIRSASRMTVSRVRAKTGLRQLKLPAMVTAAGR